ncbi:MAG: UDP-N-acetylmuramoyl-L-alanine--D-glutamate ligase [Acidimicrobiales bacterium]
MRPAISWSDLRGASVGVWGLGIEGTANLERLLGMGASVRVVEDSPTVESVLGCEVLALGAGGFEELCRQDVVVKTPGVPRRRPEVVSLQDRGIPVVGGLGLWMQEAPRDRVVAITGTKGKSTTTAIAGHLLQRLGYQSLVAGNIGLVPYGKGVTAAFDYAVVEVSSYQATDMASSPPVVAVTSLHPDHLDWHGGVDNYYADKLSLCTQPGARLTVADGDNEALATRRSSLGQEVRWVTADDADLGGAWMAGLGLQGAHNRRNAMIARACLLALGVAEAEDPSLLATASEGYEGLQSRLCTIGQAQGVSFVDDSLSTNVLPTIAALDAFSNNPVALILGGHDRGIDYAPLATQLAGRRPAVAVFTLPENGPWIGAAVRQAGQSAPAIVDCGDMEEAVDKAFAWAASAARDPGTAGTAGDAGGASVNAVVLLSPAAPSYGQFRDYKERADAFAAAMHRLQARA